MRNCSQNTAMFSSLFFHKPFEHRSISIRHSKINWNASWNAIRHSSSVYAHFLNPMVCSNSLLWFVCLFIEALLFTIWLPQLTYRLSTLFLWFRPLIRLDFNSKIRRLPEIAILRQLNCVCDWPINKVLMWMMWIVTDDGSRLPLSFFSLSIEFHSLSKIWVRYRFTKFVRSLSRCFCCYPLNWFVYLTLAHVWVCTIFHCCLICVLWISDLNLFSLENECTINKCRTLFFVCSSARTHKGHVFFCATSIAS